MSITKYSVQFPTKMTGPFYMHWGPKDAHKHMSSSVPEIMTDVKNLKGDGGVGTVREFNMVDGFHHTHLVMHTDAIDLEKHEFRFHLVDGGYSGKKVSEAKYLFRMFKDPEYGWIFRATGWLTPLPGVEITDEDITKEEELWMRAVKIFEQFMESNPDHGYPV